MANADGQIIPWVEDDQGEGIKDFVDELAEVQARFDEAMDRFLRMAGEEVLTNED